MKRGNEFKKGQFYISDNNDVFLMNGVIERTLPNGQAGIIQVQNGSSIEVTYGIESQPIMHIRVNQDNELNVGDFYEISDGIICMYKMIQSIVG